MQGPVQRTRINHMIRLSPIRLIDQDGEQVGVTETHEAMRMAQEAGLDLVEISPDARPPVCKIMDYGKYKYELSKREQKSRTHGAELKEIRLGRSIKIDPHDVGIRVDQARRFLMAGHKVQITQRFRGREMAHRELGEERLFKICQDLSDVAKIELAPRGVGRAITLVLAPDRPKIEQVKAKLAKEGKQEEEDLEKLEAEVAAENARIEAEDIDDDDSDEKTTKKKKGPKDDRAGNPVDDEVADLLGES
jgi:translation initiation factor IF-3